MSSEVGIMMANQQKDTLPRDNRTRDIRPREIGPQEIAAMNDYKSQIREHNAFGPQTEQVMDQIDNMSHHEQFAALRQLENEGLPNQRGQGGSHQLLAR